MFICVTIIILMLLLLVLGLPLFFALGISSTVGLLLGKYPLTLIVSRMFYGIDSFSLLAIPFFVLTGELLSAGGGATRLINLSRALVGHIRGSLALINILASMFFGGVNGSASADIAAIGPILIPAMVKEGYPAGYSCIVTATSAQLGPIIPPSLLMIIYGSIAELSIGQLFLAGYLPGLILTLFLSIVAYVMAIRHDHPRTKQRASLTEIVKNLKESWLVLLVPLVIVLGIVFGFFTPTESGVFAATISFVVSFFIYKTLSLEDVRKCLNTTMKTSGKLMLIISAAYIFSWILTREKFAQHLVSMISNISTNPNITMLLVILILLLAGCLLESLASLIMFGPMLLEVGMKSGFNPVHFAVVVIMVILIGGVTPPVGVGLYLTASIAKVPISEVLKYLFPFLFALIAAAFVVAFIPWFTTWGLGL